MSSSTERRTDGHGRTTGSVLSGLAVALGCVLFLGGFVWAALIYRPYTVPTDSMTPTIAVGARVLAEKVDGSEIRRGDIVVFQDSTWGDLPMVKRVVGVGGDKIACCTKQGRLTINGTPVEEPYLQGSGPASPIGFKAKVPTGQLFLLGDHRSDSLDSRVHLTDGDHGSVPRSAVNARVDARAWPLGSVGVMQRPAAFSALPGGTSQPGPVRPITLAVVAGAVLILVGAAYGPLARRKARKGA
ncbi:signal peptidase I [Streptomyces sp. 2224.1]|uniref:signal peptidase I n=1 Tax=unclassified Streptomyces TaxID=2593676 RepID=UPI00088CB3B7|nr:MULTISPECIES: signal peptidase I [unclassified Streptomyces]PBC85328.1 signal peptidase I [Streptomyces sp. 2321.6]SDR17507.1 signal peptidase I [Streptomyces sp. KS_16]SEB49921.1 signal peptidase I [Streptomyces sp. 2224.1]SED64215.1 signal peptidase I [Streptomyces sp. 2133.1]SEE19137.1 signal peptidase I [Streptomyces sp. 2112.3]